MAGDYTRQEVAYLLGIDHAAAVRRDVDASLHSSLAGVETASAFSPGAEPELPVTVRWADVDAARRIILREKRDEAIVQLRAQGLATREIAERVGVDQSTVTRRFAAKLDEICKLLGAKEPGAGRLDASPRMCLACRERPRARVRAIRRTAKHWWRARVRAIRRTAKHWWRLVDEDGRMIAYCALCAPQSVRERVVFSGAALRYVLEAERGHERSAR